MLILKTGAGLWHGQGVREQFVRFLGVGLGNTIFGYGVYAALVLLGIRPMWALGLATIAGVLFSFHTAAHFVFQQLHYRRLWRFVSGHVVVYGLNLAALESLLAFGMDPVLAQGALLPAVAIMSFLINVRFVFRAEPRN